MFQWIKSYFRGLAWPVMLAMLLLMGVSLVAIATAEEAARAVRGVSAGYTSQQVFNVVVALGGFVLATLIPYNRLGRWSYLLFAINLLALVVVLRLPAIRECHRWIDLRFFKVQPSELAKVTYILALSWHLRYGRNYRHFLGLAPLFVATLAPVMLILLEPDLGTSLLLFPTLFFMVFMAGAKIRHLLAIVGVVAVTVLAPVGLDLSRRNPDEAAARRDVAYWVSPDGSKAYMAASLAFMQPHQFVRVQGWLHQDRADLARQENFQLNQSMSILGSGGLTGRPASHDGLLPFSLLPEDHTDFIFSVIGGRWGFLGCLGVMLVYMVIFICGAEIAAKTPDPFGRLLTVGVLSLLFTQILINIGMTIGLLPITGMTLPLISYGGSSLFVNAVAMGLLVNVAQRRPILLGKPPFEFDRGRSPEPLLGRLDSGK